MTLVSAALVVGSACSDTPTETGPVRFGQIGEIRLQLEVPLRFGAGQLTQTLNWSSSGPWLLREAISYEGVEGDASEWSSVSELLAGPYLQWITAVNEQEPLRLFDAGLDPDLMPECGPVRTRVSLRIRDDDRPAEESWTRCAEGQLGTLSSTMAGPDQEAARVVDDARLLADLIFPGGFTSRYHGSVPFATLARGEHTPLALEGPGVIGVGESWLQFWEAHAGAGSTAPAVDFERQVVLVGAVGVNR